jgi:hypothetical protein
MRVANTFLRDVQVYNVETGTTFQSRSPSEIDSSQKRFIRSFDAEFEAIRAVRHLHGIHE